jgi:hypothetical protein
MQLLVRCLSDIKWWSIPDFIVFFNIVFEVVRIYVRRLTRFKQINRLLLDLFLVGKWTSFFALLLGFWCLFSTRIYCLQVMTKNAHNFGFQEFIYGFVLMVITSRSLQQKIDLSKLVWFVVYGLYYLGH